MKPYEIPPSTYEIWKGLGYHVVKGQKSTQRNVHGTPLFTREQVAKTRPGGRYPDGYDGGDPADGIDYEDDYNQFEAEYGHTRDWF